MSKRNRGAYLKWIAARNAWYIFWYEGGRDRKKSTCTRDRKQAEQLLSRYIIEKDKPTDALSPSQRTIADILAGYAEEHAIHVASRATIGFNIKALIPFWGHRTASEIRPSLCREYVQYRQTLAAEAGKAIVEATIARELGVLSAAIRHDWKEGRLTSPIPVWKPPPSVPKDRWLTRSEVVHLLRTARMHQRIDSKTGEVRTHSFSRWHVAFFILMALYTAARKEALLTLKWSQVDLERGIIDLNQPGGKITNKRRAIVPIPKRLMTFLRIARARAPEDCRDSYVIEYYGKPMLRIDQSFRRVARDAGLEGVTPHTLRHTAATWMAQAGVPLWTIAKYLGHASSRTTERVYAHHNPSFLIEAKEALDKRPEPRKSLNSGGLSKLNF